MTDLLPDLDNTQADPVIFTKDDRFDLLRKSNVFSVLCRFTKLGQKKSVVVSGRTGKMKEYGGSPFEDYDLEKRGEMHADI